MLIYPFRGILYNTAKIKRPHSVYAPPYDIISPQQQSSLYRTSPYNVIRLELNKPAPADNAGNNPYTRAAKFFRQWQAQGILKQDVMPVIYVYGQDFKYKNKMRRTLGFIALASLEDLALPHEMTFNAPRQDREKLLSAAGANLSCIYSIFQDKGCKAGNLLRGVTTKKPFIDVKADAVRHRLWRIQDKKQIKQLQGFMSGKKVFIADGHHRYEAAINLRNRILNQDKEFNKKSPYNYVMMYFVGLESDGLTVLSTHRLLKCLGKMSSAEFKKRLGDYFQVVPVKSKNELFKSLDGHFGKGHAFGLYLDKQCALLKLKDKGRLNKEFSRELSVHHRKLDVAILHKVIFEKILGFGLTCQDGGMISHTRDAEQAIQWADEGKFKAVFFLNPTKIDHVRDVCLAAEKMPHKSTYFYPKPLTGLVMRKLEAADV